MSAVKCQFKYFTVRLIILYTPQKIFLKKVSLYRKKLSEDIFLNAPPIEKVAIEKFYCNFMVFIGRKSKSSKVKNS